MAANPGFQISLDVRGRPCVVLGGDGEAAEKAQRLLDAGAKVTVISPTLNEALRKLAAADKVIHRARVFRETDAQGVLLVINTLRHDPEFSRSLLALASKERFLLCSVDQPDASNCHLPALVSLGHLRLAVSTSGVAPALAGRLRQDLDAVLDARLGEFLEWLAARREAIMQDEPDAERRRRLLRETVEGFKLSGTVTYPEAWLAEKRSQQG